MRSKKYPNLYRRENKSPYWIFRKFSKSKGKQFETSTESVDEAAAYKIGVEKFNQWLGTRTQDGNNRIFRNLARSVLQSKEGAKANTYRSAKNQIMKNLIPAFGHLRCDQITSLKWNEWVAAERKKGEITRFFNARKHLLEILRRAKEEGLIQTLPKFSNPDPATTSARYLTNEQVEKIRAQASPDTALLILIVSRMGARPGEVIQWRWDMIDWADGEHGSIDIPGGITKTGRTRRIPLNQAVAEALKARQTKSEGSFIFPSPIGFDQPIREYKTGWTTACRKAGIKATLYSLRHTFITNCAKKGVSIVFCAKYCDTSVKMIEQVYAKATPESMSAVAGVVK